MMNNQHLTVWLLENIVIPFGQVFVLLFGCSAIYLAIKYRTLAFWWSATKKEMLFVRIGIIGFLVFALIAIAMAVF